MALPDNLPDLAIAGYRHIGTGRCKCGRKLDWFLTPNNRKMPFSLKEETRVSEVSIYVMPSETRYEPHWANCPLAMKFRRKSK